MEILGVDIGGSGIKGAIVDTDSGTLLTERIRIKTPQPATPEAIADTLKELVETIKWDGPVSCGFPARVIRGTVLTAANIDKSWINTPVEQLFSKTLGQPVFVANDADVAGIAEVGGLELLVKGDLIEPGVPALEGMRGSIAEQQLLPNRVGNTVACEHLIDGFTQADAKALIG